MLRMKVYRQGKEILVAAADATLVGRTFREDGLMLAVSEAFYGTEAAKDEDVVRELRACTIANLVGERAVTLAVKAGFVSPENVLVIEGVPHAQFALLA